jgi:hypothetical protein
LQFIAVSTVFALVLATAVAGKAIGTDVRHVLASSSYYEPDLQTSSRKIPSRQAISRQAISRQTLHRQIPSSQALRRNVLRSRSALVLKDRINSAAMRVSILRALTAIFSCVTKALEKHATKESMLRAASKQ